MAYVLFDMLTPVEIVVARSNSYTVQESPVSIWRTVVPVLWLPLRRLKLAGTYG